MRLPARRLLQVAPLIAVAVMAFAGVARVTAQNAAPAAPVRFEAASVKPSKSSTPGGLLRREAGGRIEASNFPLRMLITFAYGIQGFRLVGGPDWITTERYDIVAKYDGDPPPSPPGGPPDATALSMRALLEDRFHLKMHQESRELDVYNLVMARSDGRPGAGLKPTSQDCSPDAVRQRLAAGGPPTPPSPTGLIQCGAMMNPGRLRIGGMPMTMLANALSGQVGRIVVDKTALSGGWDFELTYAPTGNLPPGAPRPDGAVDSDAPSIYTALQEELGLKLEAGKAPVDVYVIDSVDRPTED